VDPSILRSQIGRVHEKFAFCKKHQTVSLCGEIAIWISIRLTNAAPRFDHLPFKESKHDLYILRGPMSFERWRRPNDMLISK
jgi:hypothetical protein